MAKNIRKDSAGDQDISIPIIVLGGIVLLGITIAISSPILDLIDILVGGPGALAIITKYLI